MEELVVSFDARDGALVAMDENRDDTMVKMDKNNLSLNTNNELDHQLEQMIEKNEGLWKCKVCGKKVLKKSNIKSHAETHIEGVAHICHICSKTVFTRNSLRKHIAQTHFQH